MTLNDPNGIDFTSAPFDQFKNIHRLSTQRSGHASLDHVRHHLYAGRDRRSTAHVLIKFTSKPGLVYQNNLTNEIATLSTINRELPADVRYFPVLREHGSLRDGRVYLITSLFDEFPLATSIDTDRVPARMVTYLRTTLEIVKAVSELHGLGIFHVDLNPMNVLYKAEKDRPVIRIVDFESSYERTRHGSGIFYSPPTTLGYCAPEVSRQAPDARSDLFSVGALLYTLLTGYGWTWEAEIHACVAADHGIDQELKSILLQSVDPNPDRRYPSLAEFRSVLASYLEHIWPGRSW